MYYEVVLYSESEFSLLNEEPSETEKTAEFFMVLLQAGFICKLFSSKHVAKNRLLVNLKTREQIFYASSTIFLTQNKFYSRIKHGSLIFLQPELSVLLGYYKLHSVVLLYM